MMRPIQSLVLSCIVVAGCLFAPGCVSQKSIDNYSTRLKALEDGGIPDSLLSTIRVYIQQANDGKKRSNGIMVKASMDSLKVCVAAAENWAQELATRAKPRIDSLQKLFTGQKSKLTGMQLKEADSLLAIVDSYVKKTWYLQAQIAVDHLDTVMPSLIKDEVAALKVAAVLPGTWTKVRKLTGNGANAVEKGIVAFEKNGAFTMDETMKGQTSASLREDWQFKSQGAYSIKGDTIMLNIQKEQRIRENFENLANGKWTKNQRKPYDTTITNGSKDRFFTFDVLKSEYKK